jgi:hypothetical protein
MMFGNERRTVEDWRQLEELGRRAGDFELAEFARMMKEEEEKWEKRRW